jgi:hypothetical protein
MPRFTHKARAAVATVLLCVPIAPAFAGGPLLLAPLAWGGRHLIAAAVGLATLPYAVASLAAQAAPGYPTPTYPTYAGPAGYPGSYPGPDYAGPTYYSYPPAYYAAPPSYYSGPSVYRPAVGYPHVAPYASPPYRPYYAPRMPYAGYYGARTAYRARGAGYRRW